MKKMTKPKPPCHPTHHHHDTLKTKHFREWWWMNAISRLCTITVGGIHAYSYICTCHALLSCHGSKLRRYLSTKTILDQMCQWQAFLRHPRLAIKPPIAKRIYQQCGNTWLAPIAVCAPNAMGGAIFSQCEGRKAPLCNAPKHPPWHPPEDQSVWRYAPPKKVRKQVLRSFESGEIHHLHQLPFRLDCFVPGHHGRIALNGTGDHLGELLLMLDVGDPRHGMDGFQGATQQVLMTVHLLLDSIGFQSRAKRLLQIGSQRIYHV
mmetsp:Transcript_6307/g.39290  ORF Transcript_6307/g.39290 Transcript_6307/m.39290 type:complete len:263 (-) Transcript_6307:3665-4453(-)